MSTETNKRRKALEWWNTLSIEEKIFISRGKDRLYTSFTGREIQLIYGNQFLKAPPNKPPTNAISALHAISLKKGFPVEDIESIEWLEEGDGHDWRYRTKATGKWFTINLTN